MKKETYNDLFTDKNKQTDYKTIVFEYLLHWPAIVLCLLAAIASAYVYLRYYTPIYSISSAVLIKQGDGTKPASSFQLGGMQDLGTFSLANNFDNEVEILQSYTLTKKVVNKLNLYISYKKQNKFRYDFPLYKNSPVEVWMSPEEAEKLPSVMEIAFGNDGKKLTATATYTANGEETSCTKTFDKLPAVLITPAGTVSISMAEGYTLQETAGAMHLVRARIVPPSVVAGTYKAHLSATPTTEYTTIVRLVLNDTNIQRGEEFLNTLVDIYNEEANEDKNQVAMRTAEFIDERIRVINEELGTTENELASYKRRAGLTDLDTDAQLALQGNSEYDRKRADNDNQLRLIAYLREYIEDPANKDDVIPANVGLTDPALTNIIAQYNSMIIERNRLLRTSKTNSPAVVNLDASIAAARNTVCATVESVEKSLQITRDNLDMEAGKYRTRISNAPQQERELRDISRQQEIKSNLYLMLLQKREENAITLAAKANNGRIVEEARPTGRVAPNARNTYLIAFVLGLLIPAGGIWLLRSLRFRIEGRDDVRRITNATIVGDIPQVKQQETASGIVVRENRNDLIEEIFRNLRTNLQYMLQEGQQVILFTSTTSNEGKSFNAANLAASLAFMGKKTVIVGLDIRNPSLGKIFGITDKGHGITEFLASPSSVDLTANCRQTEVSPDLYVLPCGSIPPNPAELVARPSLEKAIKILKDNFDYVILDTAPIGMVTDTRIIARTADLCVYVCRAGYTHKNEFGLINELENDEKLPPLCVLINGIDMDKRKNGYHYGYGRYAKYGKYGYGRRYGYTYGYGKDNRPNDKQ